MCYLAMFPSSFTILYAWSWGCCMLLFPRSIEGGERHRCRNAGRLQDVYARVDGVLPHESTIKDTKDTKCYQLGVLRLKVSFPSWLSSNVTVRMSFSFLFPPALTSRSKTWQWAHSCARWKNSFVKVEVPIATLCWQQSGPGNSDTKQWFPTKTYACRQFVLWVAWRSLQLHFRILILKRRSQCCSADWTWYFLTTLGSRIRACLAKLWNSGGWHLWTTAPFCITRIWNFTGMSMSVGIWCWKQSERIWSCFVHTNICVPAHSNSARLSLLARVIFMWVLAL